MSYILDALKRSERERHHAIRDLVASGPAVIAPERRRRRWIQAAAGGLLLINGIGLLVWAMAPQRDAGEAVTESATSTGYTDAPPAVRPIERGLSELALAAEAGAADPATAGRDLQDAARSGNTPAATSPRNVATLEQTSPPQAQHPPARNRENRAAKQKRATASVSDEPEVAMREPAPTQALKPAAASKDAPLLEQLPGSFRDGVPSVGIDVHVYAEQPVNRFVLVNGRSYHEGERLAAGPLLERITPSGMILSLNGRRFKILVE